MEQKFSDKIDHLAETAKEQFEKVKNSKHKSWIIFAMLLIPFIPDALWILGALSLFVYLIVGISEKNNSKNSRDE